LIDQTSFLDYTGYLLAAVSLIWGLHGTMVWKAWGKPGANRRLAIGLGAVTLIGLVCLFVLVQNLAWAAEGRPVEQARDWIVAAGVLTYLFLGVVGFYHLLLIIQFGLKRTGKPPPRPPQA
jgi:hypothetical protein